MKLLAVVTPPSIYQSDSIDLLLQNDNNIDKYLLLPGTWKAMSTEHKTSDVEILKKHEGNAWGDDSFSKIADAVCVPLSELHTLQPDIFLEMEYSSHINRGYKDVYLNDNGWVDDVYPQISIVETNRKKAKNGLLMMI